MKNLLDRILLLGFWFLFLKIIIYELGDLGHKDDTLEVLLIITLIVCITVIGYILGTQSKNSKKEDDYY